MDNKNNASVRLSNAIQHGNTELVIDLVRQQPELVNHPDWTPPPLHCAVLWDQPKVAEVLLELGADLEMRDPDQQTTPLRYAIMYCRKTLIPVLLSRGASTGPITDGGSSAIQLAKNGVKGDYEQYEDLPRRHEYASVIEMLAKLGVTD